MERHSDSKVDPTEPPAGRGRATATATATASKCQCLDAWMMELLAMLFPLAAVAVLVSVECGGPGEACSGSDFGKVSIAATTSESGDLVVVEKKLEAVTSVSRSCCRKDDGRRRDPRLSQSRPLTAHALQMHTGMQGTKD